MSDLIIFEQPVNERVRTVLRLEFLFTQLAHHRQDDSDWGRRASLTALIDILSLFSRNDLKTEITRELNDRHATLTPLRERPGVDLRLLDQTLDELARTSATVQELSSQHTSQALKDSEFLLAIINRSAIPGGTSRIDMPGYHRWVNDISGQSARDLNTWVERIAPFEHAIALYLRMLRDSAQWKDVQAEDGLFVHQEGGPKFHLIRVALPKVDTLYPEISAGRQRFTIRFMRQLSAMEKDQHAAETIPFQLSLCSL